MENPHDIVDVYSRKPRRTLLCCGTNSKGRLIWVETKRDVQKAAAPDGSKDREETTV